MGYEIVRGPFVLLEAIGMLFKFVNGISFRSVLNRHKFLGGSAVTEATTRRMLCLQQIMDEVCAELDPQNAQLQRFFSRVELNGEETCIARLMTSAPFSTLNATDVWLHAEEICAIWDAFQNMGAWITPGRTAGLSFSLDEGCPGDLFVQICEMHCPAEFHVKLYKALRDFRKTMTELVQLIEPLVPRLEACFRRESWLMDEAEAYWHDAFLRITPLQFLHTCSGDDDAISGASDHTLVAIDYMNSNQISYSMAEGVHGKRGNNVLVIGSIATSATLARKQTSDIETVGSILKAIGDKKRLDVLHRLAKGRSYCHELADHMGVDPGNMSRNLALLHSFGFLRQERESLICYYEADREAVHSFLQLVETTIFD